MHYLKKVKIVNDKPYSLQSVDDLLLIPEIKSAYEREKSKGFVKITPLGTSYTLIVGDQVRVDAILSILKRIGYPASNIHNTKVIEVYSTMPGGMSVAVAEIPHDSIVEYDNAMFRVKKSWRSDDINLCCISNDGNEKYSPGKRYVISQDEHVWYELDKQLPRLNEE